MSQEPTPDFGHLLSPLTLGVTATAEMPVPYVAADHLNLLSNELVMLRMRRPGWPRNLMVMMPPRHGKSEMCSHWFPVWDLALDPTDRILLATYEADFAAKWGRAARRSMEQHYPIIGARIIEDSRAAHRWETPQGGGMTTAGVGGPLTGRGGNVLICDDPIKNAEEANSQVIRDHVWDWWQSTFWTRREPHAIVVLIMTRWHEDDICGRILADPVESKTWRVIDLPALADNVDAKGNEKLDALGRATGAALWPARYDELALESIRATVGSRVWSALYQQKPSPAEGAGINRAWWRWYDTAPKRTEFQEIIQSWDPTFKDLKTSDYVAALVMGRIGNDIYVLDGVRKRMNGPDTLKAIAAVDKQWPEAKWLLMEDTASGTMILDMLQRDRGHVERITPKGSKETRLHWVVNACAAVVERGNVYLPRDTTWAMQLVDEGAQFPFGAHDDMLDAFGQGVQRLLPRTWAHQSYEKRLAKELKLTNPIEVHNHRLHEAIRDRMKQLERRESESSEGYDGDYWSVM